MANNSTHCYQSMYMHQEYVAVVAVVTLASGPALAMR